MTFGTVSVVVPTFKRDAVLLEAVASAIDCAPRVSEILVVDDFRTDPESLCARLRRLPGSSDLVVRVFCRSELFPAKNGAQVCRNIGLREATGDYVLFLDDDDLLDKKGLEDRAAILDRRSDLDFVVGPARPFRGSPETHWGEPYRIDTDGDDLRAFLGGRVVWMTSGPLWRPSSLSSIGGWDESLRFSQDVELHVRALASGLKYEKVDSVSYHYRLSSEHSMSSDPHSYADGHRGYAVAQALAAVTRSRAWTAARRKSARRRIAQCVFECLRQGGRRTAALIPVRAGRKAGCLSAWAYLELMLLVRAWGFRVASRNLSFSLMRWRFIRSDG